ncbi:protein MOR1, partial [Tanacetum coccineum]
FSNKLTIASTATKFPKISIAGICERVAALKTRAQAMKWLTTFSEAMGTEHKNPKVLSERLLGMVYVGDFVVAHLKLKDVFDFCKDATRNATIKLIRVASILEKSPVKVGPANSRTQELSYDMSPYQSDDDYEEEDDQPTKKFIPSWCSKSRVAMVLPLQQQIDPVKLFPLQSFCNMDEDFESILCNSWSSSGSWVDFSKATVFKKKLQLLKSNLKDWRKLVNSVECASATSLREKISLIDIKAEIGPLTSDEVMTRAMSVKELANLEYSKAKDLRKKSKSKWALEGDENSRFFHGILLEKMIVDDAPGLKAFKVPNQNLLINRRTVDDEFAPGLLTFKVPGKVFKPASKKAAGVLLARKPMYQRAEMTLESRLGSLIPQTDLLVTWHLAQSESHNATTLKPLFLFEN